MDNPTKRNPYANYRVGLVMTKAGMTAAQLAFARAALKQIAKLGGAEPDGLALAVPILTHHTGPKACEQASAALGNLKDIDYLRVTVLDAGDLDSMMSQLIDSDEVWCMPAPVEPQRVQRPSKLYAMVRVKRPDRLAKFKIISPWVEARVAEAKTNPKPLKGY